MLPKPPKRGPKPKRRLSKVRKTSLGAAKRKLWTSFAAYIKRRDGNVCFTCGQRDLAGSNWQAGHMIPGRRGLVLFDPELVRSQCFRCNINLKGNAGEFALRFMEEHEYGEDVYKAHVLRAREEKKWTVIEIQELTAALEQGGREYELLYAGRYGLTL